MGQTHGQSWLSLSYWGDNRYIDIQDLQVSEWQLTHSQKRYSNEDYAAVRQIHKCIPYLMHPYL